MSGKQKYIRQTETHQENGNTSCERKHTSAKRIFVSQTETHQPNRNMSAKQKHVSQMETCQPNRNMLAKQKHVRQKETCQANRNMSGVQPHCSLTTSETPELDLVVTGSTSLFSCQARFLILIFQRFVSTFDWLLTF